MTAGLLALQVCNLKSGCEYQFRVRARNLFGVGPPCVPVSVETAAAAPGAVEAPCFAQRTANTVKVKWAPPAKENGAPVKQYR